jgi:hypothetical protein
MSALLDPEIFRPALRFAMQADVGHRLQPQPDGRIERAEAWQLQAGQEIGFDISDAPFRAAFHMSSRLHVMQSMGKKSFRSPIPSIHSSDASSS